MLSLIVLVDIVSQWDNFFNVWIHKLFNSLLKFLIKAILNIGVYHRAQITWHEYSIWYDPAQKKLIVFELFFSFWLYLNDTLGIYWLQRWNIYTSTSNYCGWYVLIWNKKLEGFNNSVEFPIWNEYLPNKVQNIITWFLMKFYCQHNWLPHSPWYYLIQPLSSKSLISSLIIFIYKIRS